MRMHWRSGAPELEALDVELYEVRGRDFAGGDQLIEDEHGGLLRARGVVGLEEEAGLRVLVRVLHGAAFGAEEAARVAEAGDDAGGMLEVLPLAGVGLEAVDAGGGPDAVRQARPLAGGGADVVDDPGGHAQLRQVAEPRGHVEVAHAGDDQEGRAAQARADPHRRTVLNLVRCEPRALLRNAARQGRC